MKEDNLGFFAGLTTIACVYAVAWSVFQWGYSKGFRANHCKERHSYHYKNVSWFNPRMK